MYMLYRIYGRLPFPANVTSPSSFAEAQQGGILSSATRLLMLRAWRPGGALCPCTLSQLAATQIPVVVILTVMNPFGAHMGCLPSMVCELPSNSQNMWPQVQFYQILTYSMATESLKHSRIFKFISI
ncbi:Os03g0666850 [Oryza sativa Japonica Group]|jgi:hypothetical protein|uniref:Uncharacterized protein n=2 Tax=Oryza sativa subsp. japonica TaxID=39947 RepID=A0A8J8XIW4_ORYSJ|nr:hypothetical protein OsJ_00623 [Oryza sativa Japonica Group]KAB8092922.1 hypothetical protein EE612_019515 [Oryza sativa]BAS85645.1 Os03g0666850 [Oryza sativa Japonica Group]